MARHTCWLTRRNAQADVQRAMVAVLLAWLGGAIGAFLLVWSVVTQAWGGVLQGIALIVVAIAIQLQGSSRH